MSALIRKIDKLKVKDIYLILKELSQDFYDNKVKDINSELQEETTKLDDEKIEDIKALLKVLVENDEAFAQKVAKIIEENEDNAQQDITIVSSYGTFIITWAEIGIFLSFLLARDLIRAFKPSEEIEEQETNEKEGITNIKSITRRKYNADLTQLAKTYFESKK